MRTKRVIGWCGLMVVALIFCRSAGAADVLQTAKDLGQQMKTDGYVYPPDKAADRTPNGKYVDCTQFVIRVVEKLIPNLPASAKKRIAMSDLNGDDVDKDKDGILTSGDSRTKGVQQALVDLQKGDVVALNDAKAGDLIQYWMKQENGKWFGHAAVIERVEGDGAAKRAWLYGSHHSLGGIGTAPNVGLRLIDDPGRKIYIVRFKD